MVFEMKWLVCVALLGLSMLSLFFGYQRNPVAM